MKALSVPVETKDGIRARLVKVNDWIWFTQHGTSGRGRVKAVFPEGCLVVGDDQEHAVGAEALGKAYIVRGVRPGFAYEIEGVVRVVEETRYSSAVPGKQCRFIDDDSVDDSVNDSIWIDVDSLPMPLGDAPLEKPSSPMTAKIRKARNAQKRRLVWCPCPHVPQGRRIVCITTETVDGVTFSSSRLLREDEVRDVCLAD